MLSRLCKPVYVICNQYTGELFDNEFHDTYHDNLENALHRLKYFDARWVVVEYVPGKVIHYVNVDGS